MSQSYFIGIDVGTTSTKAIAYSLSGAVVGLGIQGYPLLVPQSGWAEQDPEMIVAAVVTAVKLVIAQANLTSPDIAAIGIGTAMHSLIVVDASGQRLTNSIVWTDTRSLVEANYLRQTYGYSLYQRIGTPLHPMLPLTKMMWLRQTMPEIFQQAAKFISIKEYILYTLFRRFVVDYSIAGATGLFNLETFQWDEEAIALAGIQSHHLSELVPPTTLLKGMDSTYASAMGVDPHTPVAVGSSDGILANLGVGAIAPHQVAITVGTSSAVRSMISHPYINPDQRTFCYALSPKHYVIGGASNSGGAVFRWLRDQFCQPEVDRAKLQGVDPFTVMLQVADRVPIGAEGLLCLPFLSGERAPYWNAEARGVFFGIDLHHQRSHFIRALLDGILFSIHAIHSILKSLNPNVGQIHASGGFARSSAWLQMLADALNTEVLVPKVYEASSIGAAMIAMWSVGAIAQLEDLQPLVQLDESYHPNAERSQHYQAHFERCDRFYHHIASQFAPDSPPLITRS